MKKKKTNNLQTVFGKYPEWTLENLLKMTVKDFFEMDPCPFCDLSYTGYEAKPSTKDCEVCFGYGKVPNKMVQDIEGTTEYKFELHASSFGDIRD